MKELQTDINSFNNNNPLEINKIPPIITIIQKTDIEKDCSYTFKKGYGPFTIFNIFKLINIVA